MSSREGLAVGKLERLCLNGTVCETAGKGARAPLHSICVAACPHVGEATRESLTFFRTTKTSQVP